MANVFANYVNERTTGNFEVEIYAMDQLTNGSQTEGIQAVCDGSIDLSAHSNLIYSNFDQRLNVVSLPFIFDNPCRSSSTIPMKSTKSWMAPDAKRLLPSLRAWACT